MEQFWQHCVEQLAQQLPPEQIQAWIAPLVPAGYDEELGELRLIAPNPAKQKWARNAYSEKIKKIAVQWFQKEDIKVVFLLPERKRKLPIRSKPVDNLASAEQPAVIIENSSTTNAYFNTTDKNEELPKEAVTKPVDAVVKTKIYERSFINSEQTFENLVVGRSNELVVAAARKIADNPGQQDTGYNYNPFYIYGSTGLGKTHVMHAIGNSVLQQRPELKVRYIHANQYFNDMVQAMRGNSLQDWQREYNSIDLLLIDDIQFFRKKDATQEQFFYLFEHMVAQNKQIIISSDTYPRQLDQMHSRLTTRFDSGLSLALEPPELEMRVAILHNKAQNKPEVALSSEAAFFIAKHVRSNVRELEGAFTKAAAFATFHGYKEITVDICRSALKDLLNASIGQITVENIQKTVCDYYKIKISDMHSKRRLRTITKPRQIAMYLSKELTQKSLPAIGEMFGGRDHTTVLHAVRKITQERARDQELNHHLHVLEQTLKG